MSFSEAFTEFTAHMQPKMVQLFVLDLLLSGTQQQLCGKNNFAVNSQISDSTISAQDWP
jgi:hypothetical protein